MQSATCSSMSGDSHVAASSGHTTSLQSSTTEPKDDLQDGALSINVEITDSKQRDARLDGQERRQPLKLAVNRDGRTAMGSQHKNERRVLVRYKESSINLPVDSNTTPIDIAYGAAEMLHHDIVASSMTVFESYPTLGLERRIRRYERIRSVMDSWDRDTQNALVLKHSDSSDADLQASQAPVNPPTVTAYMYHSSIAGKWSKKFITLLQTGQIYTAKALHAKLRERDSQQICHLSDFDCHYLTREQLSKIRAPKKHCFAVRSQTKLAMWEQKEGYMHYFCTDDEKAATEWSKAIQTWRSWYLVHRVAYSDAVKLSGEAPDGPNQAKEAAIQSKTERDEEEDNRVRQIPFHLRNGPPRSRISSPPSSGQRSSSDSSRTPTSQGPRRMSRERHPPPTTLTRGLPGSGYQTMMPSGDDAFKSTGLLGRSYTQRRKLMTDRAIEGDDDGDGFITGPSLLNQAGKIGVKDEAHVSSEQRAALTSPKPLLDLTKASNLPTLPHRKRAITGRGVPGPKDGPLIGAAGESDIPGNT